MPISPLCRNSTFYLCFTVAILLAIVLLANFLKVPTLTRGPYLQRISEDTAIIRFRTDRNIGVVVRYGTSPDNLNFSVKDDSHKEHRLEVNNLNPDTKYYYQISHFIFSLTPPDESYFFRTNPVSGKAKATRLWVLGDSGRGNQEAIDVKQGYQSYVASTGRPADLFLMLGDNAYENGLDREYSKGLFNIYPEILKNTVLWPTLGNHDGYAKFRVSGEIPYYASFSLPRRAEVGGVPSGTESYYSFNYSDIHFICLNSYDEDRSGNGKMASWLRQDLAEDRSEWRIAFWHHPPYSKGSHNSDTELELIQMREWIVPILEQADIDLILSGHSHSYERSYLINRHYDLSTTIKEGMILDRSPSTYRKSLEKGGRGGAIYVVNGVGSSVGAGTYDHPVMQTSQPQLGSMVIDIDSNQLQGRMIGVSGEVVDQFTITKE